MQLSANSKGPLSGAVGVKRTGSCWPGTVQLLLARLTALEILWPAFDLGSVRSPASFQGNLHGIAARCHASSRSSSAASIGLTKR
jgi:hypothetical protein